MKMRYYRLLVAAIVVFLLYLCQVSAHFVLPNVSSIPPWLRPNFTGIPAWKGFENFTGCHVGERREGLENLKKYFHRFGYIQDLPSNVTDEFDDLLESAIKTYQQNFNMQPSGQLDSETVKQILRPRCGNADIVNGSTTMNAGKPVAVNTTHFHTVGHYSFFPGRPIWPSNRRDLTYAFFPQNELSNEVKNVFATAFQKWSEVIPMTFSKTESYITADIKIGFYRGDHGDDEPFDGVLGTLAHAFSPTSGLFHLDADENWVASGDIRTSTVSSAVDLESVAVHEIGHLLGLGHSSIENAIMYPTISSGTRKVELASDDIEGIQSLYGSNPNYNGSSSTSVQERETGVNSGAYRVGSWWWGLSLSVLMATRLVDIILFLFV